MSADKENLNDNADRANTGKETDENDTRVEVEVTAAATNGDDEKELAESGPTEVAESDAVSGSDREKEPKESESERYLRLAADFDNYKKRTAREFGEVIKGANTRLLKDLIEIKDSFERALDGETVSGDSEAYQKGVALIYNQLNSLLEKENVKPIEAIGKPFNPNLHDALMQQESDEYDEGIICQEMQKGYRLDNRVLRHSRVIVSSGKNSTEETSTDN